MSAFVPALKSVIVIIIRNNNDKIIIVYHYIIIYMVNAWVFISTH